MVSSESKDAEVLLRTLPSRFASHLPFVAVFALTELRRAKGKEYFAANLTALRAVLISPD